MASVEYVSGPRGEILIYQEGATPASFAKGDLVRTDTAGQVVMATAGNILGIACKGYTSTQGTRIPVELVTPAAIYRIASQAGGTALAQVGLLADVVFGAGAHTVDETSPSTNELDIVGIDPQDAIGTEGGKLLVRFRFKVIEAR